MSIPRKQLWCAGLSLLSMTLLVWYARATGAAEAVGLFDQVKRLGRGVNILGYDPLWDSLEKRRFQERHFKLIRDGGFQSVRINLHALQRMKADDGYKLGDAWLSSLDWAVKNALSNNLMVILDLHNYTDIDKDRWIEPVRKALIP